MATIPRIAALLTCHNRRELTLSCLRSLYEIAPSVEVFLTDDGSTDGTAEAVRQAFPQVRVIAGDGQLYWNRGMRRAWSESLKVGYDYYLWLNDDQVLYSSLLDELLACSRMQGDCIVSGLVEDTSHSQIIYGGYDRQKQMVQPSTLPQPIFLLNGNVVLVPHAVVQRIGILDSHFIHDLGDLDYGLTAQEHGVAVVSTRKPVAMGSLNSPCRIRLWGSSLIPRFRHLATPLGSPIGQNFYYRRKHFGVWHACAFCAFVIGLNLLPDALVARIWGNTYIPRGSE